MDTDILEFKISKGRNVLIVNMDKENKTFYNLKIHHPVMALWWTNSRSCFKKPQTYLTFLYCSIHRYKYICSELKLFIGLALFWLQYGTITIELRLQQNMTFQIPLNFKIWVNFVPFGQKQIIQQFGHLLTPFRVAHRKAQSHYCIHSNYRRHQGQRGVVTL